MKKWLIAIFAVVAVILIFNIVRNKSDSDGGEITTIATTISGSRAKIGIIPNAPDGNTAIIPSAFRDARKNKVDVLYWYLSWKDVVNNQKGVDTIMNYLSEGGETAIVVSVIHSTVLGQYPSTYRSFVDDGFAEEFSDFAADFVKKYKPRYFFIGNEGNTYLNTHQDEVDEYKEIIRMTAEKIRATGVPTKVGVVIAYHDVVKYNQYDMIKSLSEDVDLIGYTVYGLEEPGFRFINPEKGLQLLREVKNAVPGKPYAIVETGWSSSEFLESSEEEQAEFVRMFFDFIRTGDAEFVTWFLYQDGRDCRNMALSFIPPGSKPDENQIKTFEEFLCKFGLKNGDGSPKKAWNVWQEEIKNL